jgi:hypothetical protein
VTKERVLGVEYDRVLSKLFLSRQRGKKIEIPVGAPAGVGDRLTISKSGVSLITNGGFQVIDLTGATVIEKVGESLDFEEADAQGAGPKWCPRPKESGIYAVIGRLYESGDHFTVGAKMTFYMNGEDWFYTPRAQGVAVAGYPTVAISAATEWWDAEISWGDPPFFDDLLPWYQVVGHSGGAVTADVRISIVRVA